MNIDNTIIASFIAFIPATISAILSALNRKDNKTYSQKMLDIDKEKTEKQIDANIVWSARVEWIQNVRKASSEFISACYNYMHIVNENPLNDYSEYLNKIEEKMLLLILYFGPDNTNNQTTTDIFDPKTNSNKNEKIVELINNIYEGIKYYKIAYNNIKKFRQLLGECSSCENLRRVREDYFKCDKDAYGKFTQSDCEKNQSQYTLDRNKNQKIVYTLNQNLKKLCESMRIYLKIEWNRAKIRDINL